MRKQSFWLVGVSLLFSGCALQGQDRLSEQECRTAGWQEVGYEDGVQGHPAGRIEQLRQNCAKYGVQPDLSDYRQGYQRGIEQYCTAANGFKIGRAGQTYAGVCPQAQAQAEGFLSRYEQGRRLFEAEQRVARLETELRLMESDFDNLEQTLIEKEARLLEGQTSRGQRRFVHDQMQSLRERRRNLQVQHRALMRELFAAELELKDLRQSIDNPD